MSSSWFQERLRSDLPGELIRSKTVPFSGFTVRHYLGGAVMFCFALQVATGLLLSLYYIPTVADAFESMELIMNRVEYGWLVRSVHKWSSHLMVVLLVLHLITVFGSRAYGRPREITWVTGFVLLGVVLSLCFFGYLLPWDERAFFATRTGIEIIRHIPLIGENLVVVVQGGSEFTSTSLTSFYVFHTVFLPGVLALLFAVHIYLIQVHGMHEPQGSKGRPVRRMPFYPDFFRRILLFWILLLNLLVMLAFLFPVELHEQADRFSAAPADIRPEWYFLFLYQTLKLMPAMVWVVSGEMVVLGLFFLSAVFIVAVPFIAGHRPESRRSRIARGIAMGMFAYAVAMSIWGTMGHPAGG